ncbi:MAG: urate hydroxylase PuuD [Gammaproteobacteria bacterium]|nr:urate hydroxylase PuuD [Gammaproteobacteria bacterium]
MEFLEVINYLSRWGHYVFGVAWIGLLYYFNFVQGGFAAGASDSTKVELFTKLVPTALWYFRWAAMLTLITGLILLYFVHSAGTLSGGLLIGALMAIIMFLNVWLVIWPNQKIVIASNESVAGGGEADPGQADAAAKALLASRTNTFFSLPMLYLMGSTAHGGLSGSAWNQPDLAFWVLLVIVLLIEANALFGKTGPLTTVKGVIGSSVVLTLVVMAVLAWL